MQIPITEAVKPRTILQCVQCALESIEKVTDETAAKRLIKCFKREPSDAYQNTIDNICIVKWVAERKGETWDEVMRSGLQQSKSELLEMVDRMRESIEVMLPDNETTQEWMEHNYFPDMPDGVDGFCPGTIMRYEVIDPIDEFVQEIEEIRDFIKK